MGTRVRVGQDSILVPVGRWRRAGAIDPASRLDQASAIVPIVRIDSGRPLSSRPPKNIYVKQDEWD